MAGRIQAQRSKPGKAKDTAPERLKRTRKTENIPAGKIVEIPIDSSSFIRDPAYQCRGKRKAGSSAVLDADNLRKLTRLAKEGRPFKDPIELVRIHDKAKGFKGCVLVDGFHRVMATERAGKKTIRAIITDGTKKDAVMKAAQANQQHGLPTANREHRDTLRKVIQAGGYKDKHGVKPIKTLVEELGMPCNERTVRRWMEQDSPDIYRKHYARGADNEPTSDKLKTRVPDFAAEVNGIETELNKLIEKLEYHRNRPEAQEAASELAKVLEGAVEAVTPIWNEFANIRADAEDTEGLEEGNDNPF